MQVRPGGSFTLKPGRNPPLISIFSTNHICQDSTAHELEEYGYQHYESFSEHRIGGKIASSRLCMGVNVITLSLPSTSLADVGLGCRSEK
jgi:hypothetical protein